MQITPQTKKKSSKKPKKGQRQVLSRVATRAKAAATAVNAKRPRRKLPLEQSMQQAIQTLPRITNETVAEHREEVLSSARKYIYPLKHSTRRVVLISGSLFTLAVVSFFTYSLLALYRFQSTSTFIYDVTRVIPFPVAKAGSHYVSYESYLFELRHYMHYYSTQEAVDFKSQSGKRQLADFKTQALQEVVNDAYVKQLASKHHLSVSDLAVNNSIIQVRNENRLGSNEQVFAEVLSKFWGWTVADFKRELKQQLLAQQLVSTLDTGTHDRAQNVLKQLQAGADFASLAKANSDDPATAPNGGDYGALIDKSDSNVPPQIVAALFKLQPGQTSGIINTGNTLEIVKLSSFDNGKATASHIQFNFTSIDTYLAPLQKSEKPHYFITHKEQSN